MSEHTAFLDRMAERLGELDATLHDLPSEPGSADRSLSDARAALDVATDRLKALRRRGGELTVEDTQSFRMSVDRLAAQVGALRRRPAA